MATADKVSCTIPRIHNYKASVDFRGDLEIRSKVLHLLQQKCVSKKSTVSRNQTFSVFTFSQSPCVFTLFHSGYANVTKARNLDILKDAVAWLISELSASRLWPDTESIWEKCEIHNVTATAALIVRGANYKCDLTELCKKANTLSHVKAARFNPERFPGCSIRTKNCGTVLAFGSGRLVFVGAKGVSDLCRLVDTIVSAASK